MLLNWIFSMNHLIWFLKLDLTIVTDMVHNDWAIDVIESYEPLLWYCLNPFLWLKALTIHYKVARKRARTSTFVLRRSKLYSFGKTWWWVKDVRVFIIGWTIPLKCITVVIPPRNHHSKFDSTGKGKDIFHSLRLE